MASAAGPVPLARVVEGRLSPPRHSVAALGFKRDSPRHFVVALAYKRNSPPRLLLPRLVLLQGHSDLADRPIRATMCGSKPPSGYQDDGSTTYTLSRESSPTGNIDNLTSRPGHQRLIEKSPLGRICVITWLDNSTGAVQDCHILDRCRAGDPDIVRGFETIMVLDPYSFSVDCTANRVFLDSSTHIAFDNGHIVFFPTERDLNRMLSALKKEVLAPIEGQQESPARNAEGFTHHKDVFPDDIRPFHVAILSSCGRCVMRMKTLDSSSSEHDTFEPPFDEPFPIVQLHCSPYFVVWKAYKTLRNSEVHAPAHLSKEEQLIRDIGEIMWDYGLAPKA
ncbi:hypothetical protein K525DRAFT_250315 [Schizophyllum commune Loenen D]|nr:hypothetical protein K525DRAFT_250315 [Schizophyllum commune Loenen D]